MSKNQTPQPDPTPASKHHREISPAQRKRVDTVNDVMRRAAATEGIAAPSLMARFSQVNAESENASSGALLNLRLDLIDDSPNQYRQFYDPQELDQLGATLDIQVEPIQVFEAGGGRYTLISGHRRVRAARSRGLATLQAIVRSRPDNEFEHLIRVVLANEQRADTSDYERAIAYKMMIEKGGEQAGRIADFLGISRSLVSGRLSILKLPQSIQDALKNNPRSITYHHAGEIQDILKASPELESFFVDGLARIVQGDWTPRVMINAAKLAQHRRKPITRSARAGEYAFVDSGNHSLCLLRDSKRSNRVIELHIQDNIDPAQFKAAIVEILKSNLEKIDHATLAGADGAAGVPAADPTAAAAPTAKASADPKVGT